MKSQSVQAVATVPPLGAPHEAAAASLVAPVEWTIDSSHSSAQFKVRHLMVSNVRGALGAVTGKVFIDDDDHTRSRVIVSIDTAGIDTRDPKRDEHLRSPDFLDVAAFPVISFQSKAVREAKGGSLEVSGDLTIKGTSRPITLTVEPLPTPVKDPWGNVKRGGVARTSLNRKDWGLTWNMALETGGVLVGDRVDIELEVELLKQVAAPAEA